MKRYNYTAKSARCLTCANYMYGCGGCTSNEEAHNCVEYEEDLNAYVRQERDETYIKLSTDLDEEINNRIKNLNQYKDKVYIFKLEDDDNECKLITVCYVNNVPDIDESMIIHNEGIFKNYLICKRALGVNKETEAAVWNLYVKEII